MLATDLLDADHKERPLTVLTNAEYVHPARSMSLEKGWRSREMNIYSGTTPMCHDTVMCRQISVVSDHVTYVRGAEQ